MTTGSLLSFFTATVVCVLIVLALPDASLVFAAAPAGYSEYYVPGDEDSMMYILDTIGAGDQTTPNTMHAEITVTAWSDNTTVYYDHWEDGYDFDPGNPSATADETVTLTNRGDSNAFQGNNIPLPRTTAASCSPAGTCYYDGRDRFYVAGGAATVSRASWTDMAGTLLAVAWEVYPVRPQLTTYILPFGEDLAAGPQNLQDFERVFALVQATSNSTTISVDFNGDDTPDDIDPDRDGDCSNSATSVTLNQGEVYVVDDLSNCSVYGSLNTGTIVKGTNTLQVQYVIGDQGSNYEIRGFSAFPRGLWDDEYYAPVDGPTPSTTNPVDLYLHNPHSSALNINYETAATTGSFSIPAKSTVSFEAETGSYVPTDSAVYLKGDDVFWGVSSIDIENTAYDWGYSLVPAFLLSDEYFMGWAPGYYPPPTDFDASGLFITAAQENLMVFIDTDNDGTADQTYTLDRLQTQYVYDPVDGDMSDANIWATGPITIAYGQNSDTAPAAAPAIDVGYTTIPGGNFIDKVLTVDKSADPVVVPAASGSTTTFTLEINSYNFSIDDISVSDLLPAGWQYVDDSTTITLADKSTVSGDSADPTLTLPTPTLYRDFFETTVYNNNGDNQPGATTWDTDWNEEGEADGAAAGIIQVTTDTGVTPNTGALQFKNPPLQAAQYRDSFQNVVYNNNTENLPVSSNWTTDWNEEDEPTSPSFGRFQVATDTGVIPNASALELDFSVSPTVQYGDNFEAQIYNNNGDNLPAGVLWTTDWNEEGEGTDPTGGDIQIENDGALGSVLRIKDNDRVITRMADLSGLTASTISLSFDYRRMDLDTAGDFLDVQVCENAVDGGDITCSDAGGWTTVTTIAGPTNDATYQNFSINLVPPAFTNLNSANFAIRFSTSGTLGNNDYIYIDNLAITGTMPATTSSISRMADLSNMSNTVLSFDYRRVSMDSAGDYADIEVCENAVDGASISCPGGWIQVLRIAGPTTDAVYLNSPVFNLSTYLTNPSSASFAVRVTSQEDGNSVANLFIDNLAVTGQSTSSYSIARMADLSGMSDTYLSIDYRRVSLDSTSDYADIEVCENATNGADITCPAGWIQVLRIVGPTTDATYQNYQVDLDTLMATPDSAIFAVRVTSEDDNNGNFDLFIDNVIIAETLASSLDWPSSLLGSMGANQQITITFDAQTTKDFTPADITRNLVEAEGTRSVGAATQTFIASDFAYNTFGDLEVSKTSDGVDPLSPGDSFTYTVTINNTSTTQTLTGIGIYDPIQTGLTYVSGSSEVTYPPSSNSTVGDLFETAAYDNNEGTADWSGDWTEINDDGSPTAGSYILMTGGELRLDNRFDTGVSPEVQREVDLTGATTASWSFDWRTGTGVDTTDVVDIRVDPGTGTWTTLESINNINGASSGTKTYDLTSYISAATRISIMINNGSYTGNNEQFFVDNLFIIYDVPSAGGSAPGNDPPNFIAEDDNYQLEPGQSMTLTFDVQVDDPLPSGLEEITNTASVTTNEFILPITASVTNTVLNPSTSSASVGDRVWLDTDGDGMLDVGESGLANVEVTLKDQFGTPVDTVYTDSNGNFLFTGVTPGSGYYVQVTGGIPAGLQQSAPAGHSDDSTEPFDLSGGDEYLVADLGYTPVPGSATFGNLVWSDADSDGVHDAGEPGISGVTVAIYLDDGDAVFEPGTDDSLVSTTVTAADGSYLFAGISASGTEDYFIYVDDTQAALTNYTNTTPITLLEVDVNAGDSFSNYDFGFNNATDTNSIRDRVWIDTNGDDEDDGESGIAGVTVALLDSSRNVIATTTTDASGYFEFNGVYDNNADYTIQITDTFGVLTDYYGTSAAAIAGEMDIDNLSSDIDNTVEPAEPNFAYAIKSAIGGTVFNDLDGDGVQDAGELGISAVDVELYLDNGITPGVLDGSDTLLYTDTTDAVGSYIFSGLADNDYIISITGVSPLSYTYTSEPPGGDNDPAAGEQQTETIASASSNLALDFGYQAIVSQTISGTVWDDNNANGSIDGGETLFENVTVDLYLDDGDSLFDSGLDTLTASVSSDANGDFNFSGLLQGIYWVVITDDNSILAGYDPAYEVTEGLSPPFNSREIVDLTGGDQTGIIFGFFKPVPTLVVITDFRALVVADDQVIIEWVTGFELDTIGFYLYRFDPESKKYRKVRKELLPAEISAPQGSIYQIVDREAVPGRLYMYRLVEKERSGRTRSYGPFTVLPGILASPSPAQTSAIDEENDNSRDRNGFRRTARKALKQKAPRRTMGGNPVSASSLGRNASVEALKIAVTEDGIYNLSAGEIASMLGKKERDIRNLVRRGRLSLQNRGREIAWIQDDGNQGIMFYGQAIDSLYTRENVYWLRAEKGMVMDKRENRRRRNRNESESLSFSSTLHIEEDHYPVAAYASDPESDYWYWDFVYGGAAGLASKSFSFEAPEVADLEATAVLRVVLAAATDTAAESDHHVIISMNGTVMGAERWDGLQPHVAWFSFDQELLHEGLNSLEITALLDSGVPYSVVGLDSFELTYERRFVAVNNKILFQGEKDHALNISGFTDNNVLVFDITNPLVPVQHVRLPIDGGYGNYHVEFRPGSSSDQYLALTENTVAAPDAVSPVRPAGLRSPANRADYLIITTEELSGTAQSLADYRSAEGLRTMIVTLNDIMDAFNYGISSPLAIRAFLQYASDNWVIGPRFVVLAGDGTYDYRDLMGNGDNLVPTLMVPTPNGLSVSDTSFADLDGDGLPEIAVGRLPAQDPEDLMAMINKITAYEKNGGNWRNRMIYIADDPDAGGNFPEDSEFIAALAPMSYDLQKVYLTEQSLDLARNNIINGLNNGAAYLNYIGHAATDRLAQEGILRIEDIPSLNSQSGHPVILAMTCAVGQFALPGWEALSEALMRKADGGAAAIWSPTGYSYNHEAMILNEEFHWIVFRDGEKILGNAILQSLRNYRDRGGQPHLSAIYTLLGDPALHLGASNYGQRRRKR